MALTGLQKMAKAIEAFDPEKEIQSIIRKNTGKLEELQKEQLAEGKNAKGDLYRFNGRSTYSPFTIAQKKKYGVGIGAITSHFTLYNSGDLYNQLKLLVKGYSFDFKSSVPYFDAVMKSVGEDVIGLNEESRKEFYKEILLPQFKKVFEAQTGVKLNVNL